MHPAAIPLQRREAIQAAAAALGAVACCTLSSPQQRKLQQSPPATRSPATGYRLTEHVRRYYRSTLV